MSTGIAYVFRRATDAVWTQTTRLVLNDPENHDHFARALAINGDFILVGAPSRASEQIAEAGAMYLFRRYGEDWLDEGIFVASEPKSGDALGWAVATDGESAFGGAVVDGLHIFAIPPRQVPTMSNAGLVALGILLTITGIIFLRRRTSIVIGLVLFFGASAADAQHPSLAAEHHPERLLVRFKEHVTTEGKAAVHASLGARKLRQYSCVPGLTLVKVPPERLAEALDAYLARSEVLSATPDHVRHVTSFPSDTDFANQWGMHNTGQTIGGQVGIPDADIDAPEAWDLWTGDPEFRIAVLDTGALYIHSNLADTICRSLRGIPLTNGGQCG